MKRRWRYFCHRLKGYSPYQAMVLSDKPILFVSFLPKRVRFWHRALSSKEIVEHFNEDTQ